MRFDRRVSQELVSALSEGWLEPLVAFRNCEPTLRDLQLRRTGNRDSVSLYIGLSAVLSVDLSRLGYRIRSHPTYQAAYGFDPAWAERQAAGRLAAAWAGVEAYVERIVADNAVLGRLIDREGQVHPLMCSGLHADYRVIQREAAVSFPSAEVRKEVIEFLAGDICAALNAAGRDDPWWPGVRDRGALPSMGSKVDMLAVDDAGRLLVIEAKPPSELKGIAWAPAQVTLYAVLFERLAGKDGFAAVLNEMLAQRVAVGLTHPGVSVAEPVTVVPVVAIGPGGGSAVALTRLAAVAAALEIGDSFEVWLLDGTGGIRTRWRPSVEPVPGDVQAASVPSTSPYVEAARGAAEAWKQSSATLPRAARAPGPYRGIPRPFCLPAPFSRHNLLPEAREIALERFRAAGISWHQGVAGGPSVHLLSSQVQCANALAPLVERPDALATMFSSVLPIAEVLPFGSRVTSRYDETDHVVFEWTGHADYLGEHPGRPGIRGAHNTSADAAFRYTNREGTVEVALIEWKYVEQYVGHPQLSGGEASTALRRQRYHALFADADGPLRRDLIPYEDLFVEPFYQLMRLQLLASAMEKAGELGAQIVRLLVVAPSANVALAQSFNRPSQRDLGSGMGSRHLAPAPTVFHAWRAMQRRPDRFAFLDSSALVAPEAPTSAEFKMRYGHLAVETQVVIAAHEPATVDRARAASEMALAVLRRVGGDGGVIAQIAEAPDAALSRADPLMLNQLAARLEELSELARRVRAEEVAEVLEGVWKTELTP